MPGGIPLNEWSACHSSRHLYNTTNATDGIFFPLQEFSFVLSVYFIHNSLSILSCILPFVLTVQNTTQPYLPLAWFEPVISARARPQTLVLYSWVNWDPLLIRTCDSSNHSASILFLRQHASGSAVADVRHTQLSLVMPLHRKLLRLRLPTASVCSVQEYWPSFLTGNCRFQQTPPVSCIVDRRVRCSNPKVHRCSNKMLYYYLRVFAQDTSW